MNVVEIAGICKMHHWLRGWTPLHQLLSKTGRDIIISGLLKKINLLQFKNACTFFNHCKQSISAINTSRRSVQPYTAANLQVLQFYWFPSGGIKSRSTYPTYTILQFCRLASKIDKGLKKSTQPWPTKHSSAKATNSNEPIGQTCLKK